MGWLNSVDIILRRDTTEVNSRVSLVSLEPTPTYLVEPASGGGISITTSEETSAGNFDRVTDSVLATVTRSTEGFWIHVDLDVVDSAEMPAVDCPEPDGLSFSALTVLLGRLLASPKCVGIEVAIYDPDLDPSGACADSIVRCLTQALSPDG